MNKIKLQVIIKYFPVLRKWGICHAKSHQAAFRSMFDDRQAAIDFLFEKGLTGGEAK